jgi:hypothetical protein
VESPNALRSTGFSRSNRFETRIPANHFLILLGQVPVMPQATVGPPARRKTGPRADSQDLMDRAQDAQKKLPKR